MNYEEITAQNEHATIEVDKDGFIVAINEKFTELLGYGSEIVGQPLSTIVPPVMQDAHHMGFSRYVVTGKGHILEQDVILPTLHSSGEELRVRHHIASGRRPGGKMRIVSMIRPAE